jgi:hypothetical protein
MTKQQFLKLVKKEAGAPVLPIEIQDDDILEYDVVPAIVEYWNKNPKTLWSTTFNVRGSATISFPTGSIGLGAYHFSTEAQTEQAITSDWSLLHTTKRSDGNQFLGLLEADVIDQFHMDVSADFSNPDVFVEVDLVSEQVKAYYPMDGYLALQFYFAEDSTDVTKIPTSDVIEVVKRSGAHLLRHLMNIRSLIEAETDVKFNTEMMRERADKLEEEVGNSWNQFSVPIALWGG